MINFKTLCSNLVTPGKYKAIVTELKFKIAPAGNATKDLTAVYTICEGPNNGKVLQETISEKAFGFKLMPLLMACDVDVNREFATDEELFQFGIKQAKGKTVNIEVKIDTYNGKEYNKIGSVSHIPDSVTSADDISKEFGTEPIVGMSAADLNEITAAVESEPQLEVAEDAKDEDGDLGDLLEQNDTEDNPF